MTSITRLSIGRNAIDFTKFCTKFLVSDLDLVGLVSMGDESSKGKWNAFIIDDEF